MSDYIKDNLGSFILCSVVILVVSIYILLPLCIDNKDIRTQKIGIDDETLNIGKVAPINKEMNLNDSIKESTVDDKGAQSKKESKESKSDTVDFSTSSVSVQKSFEDIVISREDYINREVEGISYKVPKSMENLTEEQLSRKLSSTHTGLIDGYQNLSFDNITNTVNIKDGDEELLARLIMSEAGDQPYEGMLAVGAVVMNRAKVKNQTLSEVIYAKSQFDGVHTKWFNVEPEPLCWQSSREVLSGVNVMPKALYFADLNLCDPNWAKVFPFIQRIGDHWFYEQG